MIHLGMISDKISNIFLNCVSLHNSKMGHIAPYYFLQMICYLKCWPVMWRCTCIVLCERRCYCQKLTAYLVETFLAVIFKVFGVNVNLIFVYSVRTAVLCRVINKFFHLHCGF